MPEQTFLDIRHLDAGYGRSQVLFDVNIGIPWRGGVAVLGRNGAGKTTLMKTIVGELASSQGELSFDGRDITRRRTEERVRSGIGYVPQEHSVFARLSVRDNLAVGSLSNSDASAVEPLAELREDRQHPIDRTGVRIGQRADREVVTHRKAREHRMLLRYIADTGAHPLLGT
ncbi:MAG: ATP-binding cassette domain-containing protein, partial [Bradyrhizobium sp.]